jgi:hypothetical protein
MWETIGTIPVKEKVLVLNGWIIVDSKILIQTNGKKIRRILV